MGEQQYAIEMRGICKSFGSVAANKNVNLNVKPGEILALLGENGSAVIEGWDLKGKIVMVSDWEKRDAVPVVTAAGLTVLLAFMFRSERIMFKR